MRSAFRVIASKDPFSMVKFNCVAKRMALIIRKGSSEYVISGFSGVLIILESKSLIPSKGSNKAPKSDLFKLNAKAFMVKSRLF